MADALFRGLIDSVITTLDYGLEQGLQDTTTHISIWNVQPQLGGGIFANPQAFNELPDDLKVILTETSLLCSECIYYASGPEEEAFKVWAATTALQFVYPDPTEVNKAREIVQPTIDDWVKLTGPDGQRILDITAKYIK